MIHYIWYICILIRLIFALNLKRLYKYSKYTKIILLLIGLGFAYKSLFGSNNEFQISKVFWHHTRIYHAIFYLAAFLVPNIKVSTQLLVFDVIFSILYRTYLEIN